MDPIRKRKIFLNQLNADLQIEFNTSSYPLNQNQIEEIARLNPLRLSDFDAIKGLGAVFKENFGQIIIDRLQAFNLQESNLNENDTIQTTLKELEKRLINISKRNRLLYLSKTSPKTSIDLTTLIESDLEDLLFNYQKVKLVDLKDEHSKEKYQSLNEILKNVNKAYRETGNFDLYIATPFVIGQFISDPFTIRAPLALFPINLLIDNKSVYVTVDQDKDVLINTNLIVAAQYFLKKHLPLIPMGLEEINPQTFIEDLVLAYQQQGLNIELENKPLIPFENKTLDSFLDLQPGIFTLENVALLGYFPILSTSIQRDYVAINQLNTFPTHVLTLLETIQTGFNQQQDFMSLDEIQFKEEHLAYINPLNTSQEQAQLHIKKGHHLVIQGPPGTGKSQTISNIIAQSIYDKKNVLMVSEKKAAIDVVYSRLSHLNQYALILDNINNKQRFYQQCESLFLTRSKSNNDNDLNNHNEAMNSLLEDTQTLKELLTTPLLDQLTLCDLYPMTTKIDYHQAALFEEYDFLKKHIDSSIFTKYEALSKLELSHYPQQLAYLKLKQEIPYVANINLNLSDYDILKLKQEYSVAKQKFNEYELSNFLTKLFKKNQIEQILNPFKLIYPSIQVEDINSLLLVLENYTQIIQFNNIDIESNLLLLIDDMSTHFNETPENTVSRLLNFIRFETIQTFENQYRALSSLIETYPQIIAAYNESSDEKTFLFQQLLSSLLQDNREQLKKSKRSLEMQRIIERKRKWSISKFVDRFYVELFDGIKIWLLTPDVVSEIFPLIPDLFDVLIFDEASQLYIEKAIPSILRSKQVIIAGDSQQLRPSAFGVGRYSFDDELEDEFIDATAALDEESLLDLARFKYPSITLNYHYRSLYEELIAFSNAAFYNNQLIVSPNALSQESAPIIRIKVENGLWKNRQNKAESEAVVQLVKELLLSRTQNETIGIITFNAIQRSLIEKELENYAQIDEAFKTVYEFEKYREEKNEDLSLFVKNIENVQGDERDIIIFSMTYAFDETGRVPSFFGWLSQQGGENRLNVAITRAKKQIYVVTSIEPHELPVSNSKYKGPKLLQEYLKYAKAVSHEDFKTVKQLLKQLSNSEAPLNDAQMKHPFVIDVEQTLNSKGYQTQYQVGVGEFTIELAVYKDAQLLADLEFDVSLYLSDLNDRARDIHQPNYLKSRGWKIIRLFSYQLYHSRDQFYEHLCQQLEA